MSRTSITLGAFALALGLASPAMAQEKLKVGFIYVGPVGDFGWSYQHDVGRKAIEAAFPGKVETTYIENVPEADSERSIEQLARTGHKLIFTTSFGYMEPTLKVAKKYPNVMFEHATGFKQTETAEAIGVRDMNTGAVKSIARSETQSIKTGGTLMPDGLTASFSPKQLADLIRYLSDLGKENGGL